MAKSAPVVILHMLVYWVLQLYYNCGQFLPYVSHRKTVHVHALTLFIHPLCVELVDRAS